MKFLSKIILGAFAGFIISIALHWFGYDFPYIPLGIAMGILILGSIGAIYVDD